MFVGWMRRDAEALVGERARASAARGGRRSLALSRGVAGAGMATVSSSRACMKRRKSLRQKTITVRPSDRSHTSWSSVAASSCCARSASCHRRVRVAAVHLPTWAASPAARRTDLLCADDFGCLPSFALRASFEPAFLDAVVGGLGAAPLLDEPANSFAPAFAFELALLPAAAAAASPRVSHDSAARPSFCFQPPSRRPSSTSPPLTRCKRRSLRP